MLYIIKFKICNKIVLFKPSNSENFLVLNVQMLIYIISTGYNIFANINLNDAFRRNLDKDLVFIIS